MKLYDKIQELITESETLKQKNDEVLALANSCDVSESVGGVGSISEDDSVE
ncbi:hypothetical protein ACQJ6I_05820 [Helicobacter pylori]